MCRFKVDRMRLKCPKEGGKEQERGRERERKQEPN